VIPVAALRHVGHGQLVRVVEARDALAVLVAEAQPRHAVGAHAHSHVPADHVGDGERPLHPRLELVPLLHILPIARLGAAGPLAGVLGIDLGQRFGGVRLDLDLLVLALLDGLLPLGADHQAILRGQERVPIVAEDLGAPLVNRALRELALLFEHAHQRVALPHGAAGPQGSPPFPGHAGVEGVDAAERVALHERPLVGGDFRHLVDAGDAIASDHAGNGDDAFPPGLAGVLGIAPQRVVVADGVGEVANGVFVRHAIVRAQHVGHCDADPLAEPRHSFLGDLGHASLL
jgi:hypothetical protein